jgi:integrase
MEFRSVLANLSEHWRDYVEFFYLCGMRPKEIRSLSWPDVDAGCIRLRAENAKTGHSRSIALTGQTADLIARRRLQMSPNKFQGAADGRPQKGLENRVRLAGCPGKLLYDLRRTFCRDGIRRLPFNLFVFSREMVRPERFELPTFWFVARRSIQLS